MNPGLLAVPFFSAALAADPAVRNDIDLVLRDMTVAVMAGDADGYLAHVYDKDSNFLHEQRYWANDLRKKKPLEFALALAEDNLQVGDGRVVGDLEMIWRMPGDGDEPRSVAYPVQFILSDGQWRYAGEVWERFQTDRCVVFFEPGFEKVAQSAAEVLPDVRRHVHAGFGFDDHAPLAQRTQEIKLYPSMKHLQASITLSYRDGLGGWNEPGESIKLLVNRRRDPAGLKVVLAHEYGHVATFELGPRANSMPWWLLEGVAELSSEAYSNSARRADLSVRRWARDGRLADWDQIADFENTDGSLMGHVYTQGHQFLGYISERFGRQSRLKWMSAMANGQSLDEATRRVFGMPFARLDEEWRGALQEPVLPVDTPSAPPAPSGTDQDPAEAGHRGASTTEKADAAGPADASSSEDKPSEDDPAEQVDPEP